MIDAATQARLQALFQREGRSLLQYLGDSFPWVTEDDPKVLEQIKQVIDEERHGVAEVAQALTRNRLILPCLPSYPSSFTNFNNVTMVYVTPDLIAFQRRLIAMLAQDLAAVSDPDLRAVLQKYLEMKQRHLRILEALPKPQLASVGH